MRTVLEGDGGGFHVEVLFFCLREGLVLYVGIGKQRNGWLDVGVGLGVRSVLFFLSFEG